MRHRHRARDLGSKITVGDLGEIGETFTVNSLVYDLIQSQWLCDVLVNYLVVAQTEMGF